MKEKDSKLVENFRLVVNRYGYYKVQERIIFPRNIKKFKFFKIVYWKDRRVPRTDRYIFNGDKGKEDAEKFFNQERKGDIERQKYEEVSYKESMENKVYSEDLDETELNLIKAHRRMKE